MYNLANQRHRRKNHECINCYHLQSTHCALSLITFQSCHNCWPVSSRYIRRIDFGHSQMIMSSAKIETHTRQNKTIKNLRILLALHFCKFQFKCRPCCRRILRHLFIPWTLVFYKLHVIVIYFRRCTRFLSAISTTNFCRKNTHDIISLT